MRNPIPHTAPASRAPSVLRSPIHAIATPKPDLLFAIASDDVEEVRRVLESGEAGPNEQIGPQSPLAFALTNDRLKHKVEIVKALLAYGAEPFSLNNPSFNSPRHAGGTASNRSSMVGTPPPSTVLENMDPATRYYINRANAAHTRKTSALIHRSFFRPLTRVRYDIVGQDHVFAQLFKALSAHSRQLAVAPIVVLLCGPSGHGKSLLARKFGSLLDVPTHTVNMTTLRSPHDLWDSYSMSPYEDATTCTLSEFLLENEGKRCVVVLDEIEKTEDPRALYPLLMPWEIGRCSPRAGDRHIDVRNVVWLGTSNIGHDVVVDYQDTLSDPSVTMTQDEYLELVNLLRPKVSDRLGASLLSRVTAVLPFVPFTDDEKMAIATEAFYSLGGNLVASLAPEIVEETVRKSLANYTTAEGARSLYRAVSSLLLDIPDAE
ncbi:P-loop containing nucleoside triphosphate hydrolase protein [Dentipellis sp. KUC8613]|nr:P-loop containing nucleoside triphosphate hydrolase protein [Dentipellis sp. KUC8613]